MTANVDKHCLCISSMHGSKMPAVHVLSQPVWGLTLVPGQCATVFILGEACPCIQRVSACLYAVSV